MLHGAVENGRIFYTENNKGFACFLARAQYRFDQIVRFAKQEETSDPHKFDTW